MRILFVKPNMGLVAGRPYHDRGRMEPLTFGVLAGFTPPHHEVHLCDDRFEPVPYQEPWDVVGINVEIYTARRAWEIADRFRAARVPVVVGGFHVTLLPSEARAHADAVVLGDADAVWTGILADLEVGRLQPVYQGVPCQGTFAGYRTRWDLYRGKRYLPVALTWFGRGCVNRCQFCATGALYGGRSARRPVEDVVRDVEASGRKLVFFVDDNLVADHAAALDLFRALEPLGIRWTAQASLDFASDPPLLAAMVRSGCQGLVVGFESRDEANLQAMRKGVNLSHGSYDEVVERIQDAGLMLWAAFLLGYDHDTPASIRETVDWALSKKFAFSAFNILMPYPSTPFRDDMAAQGRLLFDGCWWLHDDYRFGHGAFRPRHMSAEELGELGLEARLRHSAIPQILRRATEGRTNARDAWSLLTYFAYNPLFRDEMKKKHGMMLGYRGFERDPDPGWSGRLGQAAAPVEVVSSTHETVRSFLTRLAETVAGRGGSRP